MENTEDIRDLALAAFVSEPMITFLGTENHYQVSFSRTFGDLDEIVKKHALGKSDIACLEALLVLGMGCSETVRIANSFLKKKKGGEYLFPPDDTRSVYAALTRLKKSGLVVQFSFKNSRNQVYNFFALVNAGYRYLYWNGGSPHRIVRTDRDIFLAAYNPAEIYRKCASSYVAGKLVERLGEQLLDITALEHITPIKKLPERYFVSSNRLIYNDAEGRSRVIYVEPAMLKFDETFGSDSLQRTNFFQRIGDINWHLKFARRETVKFPDGSTGLRYESVILILVVESKRDLDYIIKELAKRDDGILEYTFFTTCNHLSSNRLVSEGCFLFKTVALKKSEAGEIAYKIVPVDVAEIGFVAQ